MNPLIIPDLLTPLGLIVFFIVGKWYVLPALYKLDFQAALTPLLLFSAFRYLMNGAR